MLDALDVAIGVTFYFLLVSIVVMAATEIVELMWKKRGEYLARGVRSLLQDPSGDGLSALLFDHPLVRPLRLTPKPPPEAEASQNTTATKRTVSPEATTLKNKPTYIPPRDFALALLDLLGLTRPANGDATLASRLEQLKTTADLPPEIQAMTNGQNVNVEAIKRALRPLLADAGTDLAKARRSIEDWYNSAMSAVSGWYKRHAHRLALGLGFLFAGALNADAVFLVRALSQNEDLRAAYVAAAEAYVNEAADASTAAAPASGNSTAATPADTTDAFATATTEYRRAVEQIETLGVPLGWGESNPSAQWPGRVTAESAAFTGPNPGSSFGWWLVFKVLGLIVTGIAISLGAPFWFDLLNKFMVVRSTVKPNEKTQPEDSEDRQTPINPTLPDLLFANAAPSETAEAPEKEDAEE